MRVKEMSQSGGNCVGGIVGFGNLIKLEDLDNHVLDLFFVSFTVTS